MIMLNQLNSGTRHCLDSFEQGIKNILRDKLYGIYLYGSIALGAYEANKSDVDFIVLLHDSLSEREEQLLLELHKQLLEEFPTEAHRLDGLYLFAAHAGLTNAELFPYPYVTEGRFHVAGHWDINQVTWWVLKNKGIVLAGPAIEELPYTVEAQQLLETMHFNIYIYWTRYLERLQKGIAEGVQNEDLLNDLADAVLTLCRIFYTIQEKEIISKTAAGKWYKALLETEQREMLIMTVNQALLIRQGESNNINKKDYLDNAIQFIGQMIEMCKERL